ncbi:MAG: hypothetical protein Q8O91_05430 [Candidatus Aminicenantes bacterium]|nr:hypothetical protein [Candidatus Aminicenantes bacterium]
MDPRAKPGALTRDVNTRLSAAEADPQTKPALIRFANEDCKAWGPCRRPGRRREMVMIHERAGLNNDGLGGKSLRLKQNVTFRMFGLSYTFGSIYTNVINPRFGSGSGTSISISM